VTTNADLFQFSYVIQVERNTCVSPVNRITRLVEPDWYNLSHRWD